MPSNAVSIEEVKTIIGDAAFNKLVSEFPGSNIYIPKNYKQNYYRKLELRDEHIRADFIKKNMSVPDLALKYDLSKARIYKIVEQKQDTYLQIMQAPKRTT